MHLDGYGSVAESNFVEILSISNQENYTAFTDSTPTIVFTNVSSYYCYNLQVDNDADFSSPLINLSFLNESAYPANFIEVGDTIEFTLPNTLQSYGVTYGWYYWRVRVQVEGTTT